MAEHTGLEPFDGINYTKDMVIKNKIVIVTGASSGIGKATAKLLAKHGAKVALVARSKNILSKLENEIQGSFSRPTDMTDAEAIREMIQEVLDHYGRIDILINNAGQGYDALIESTNIDTFKHIFDLDLVSPLVAMQQVIPIMKSQNQGLIINISSGTALMHLPGMGAYAAIKSALAHISLTAREELKDYNVDVSVIYPYITLTDFEENTIKELPDSSEAEKNGSYVPPKADSAEFVAKKIIDCIDNSVAEVFVHDWMKPGGQ